MAEVDPMRHDTPGSEADPDRGSAVVERTVGLFAAAAGLDLASLPDSQQRHTNHEGEQ